MKNDPIVEEIHQIREKMLEECGGSLNRLLDRLKSEESGDRDRIVTLDTLRRRRSRESDAVSAGKRLAALGGTEKQLKKVPRRRSRSR